MILIDLMRIISTVFDTPILYPQTISVIIQKIQKDLKKVFVQNWDIIKEYKIKIKVKIPNVNTIDV